MDEPPMTDHRVPPHDIDAETIALGSMMLSEHAAERVSRIVTAGDFYRPAHQIIYDAILKSRTEHGSADAAFVAEYIVNNVEVRQMGGLPYLYSLVEFVPTPANGPYFADKVRALAVRRRLIAAGLATAQIGYEIEADDTVTEVAGVVQRAIEELEAVRDFESGEEIPTQTIEEFLAVEDESYDWIVPDLLERGDRLMLTGMEGLGKSMLLRQIAVCIAAGVHPFKHTPIPPKRVLIVDAENSDTQTRRKMRPMVAQARLQGFPIAEDKLWIEPGIGSMDLSKDRAVSWLLKRIALIRPDVLVIGPLYQLVPRALQTDDDTAPVLAALNLVRERGVALLMEAHAGHAVGTGGKRDLRPRGSASLMGWPEFGYGVRTSDHPAVYGGRRVELVPWRGDRDEREWPEELESGGRWPWVQAPPAGFNPTVVPHHA
jgi:replicative DNA helicase